MLASFWSCLFILTAWMGHSFVLLPVSTVRSSFGSNKNKASTFELNTRRRRRFPSNEPQEDTIPANLRRQVYAKRPVRGDMIPKEERIDLLLRKTTTGGSSSSGPKLYAQGKPRQGSWNRPSRLRIAAGVAKGRRLVSPQVFLRPMMGKVREAIFNTLTTFGLYRHSGTSPLHHLDLFAGSGSVGLESLSRGARHATFCDFSQDCCNAVEENIEICRFHESHERSTQVVCGDALKLLREPYSMGIPEGRKFGLITICPPYEEVVYADLLQDLVASPLMAEDSIAIVEYPVELWDDVPHVLQASPTQRMVGVRNRKYGRTVIAMYIFNPTGNMPNANSRPEEFV
eukprot:Nitzschia sp. Nitz4//scaffold118_size93875//73053//74291//NITZ4_004799-RA/size93875-augustus-gene-0.88-mRNA-1//1//CDS//3329533757//7228//frame0